MGQSLDLCFVSRSATTWGMLGKALAKAGLQRSGGDEQVISYYQWHRGIETVQLGADVHQGAYDPSRGPGPHYVTVFLPDRYFPRENVIEASRELFQDFLILGENIWEQLSFDEGMLAPEDTGFFLSRMDTPDEKDLVELASWSYAHFTSPEIQPRLRLSACVKNMHPEPKIISIANGGLLMIWDDSPSGVARFLSLF